MIFWTLLLSALFTMGLLYVIFGPKKIWFSLFTYALLSTAAVLVIYYNFNGLYTLDLVALVIPYLFVIPLHFSVSNIIQNYVLLDDTRTSIFFIAIFNRILIALWGSLIILLIGAGLAVMDGFLTNFDAENIWSISVTGALAFMLFIAIISLGYKKKFTYVLITGESKRFVFEYQTTRSRLIVKNHTGVDKAYPRGFYQENGIVKYLYYIDKNIDLANSKFKPLDSELFNFLKDHVESYETLEHAYNEYIEQKNSI